MKLRDLYESMLEARLFELAAAQLWQDGLISGEMHLGTGEEAIAAGVVAHLRDGDAVALDHRPTHLLTLLGVDPVAMLREMLGREDGLCGGWGGHMHLFSREHSAASSGIVGASAPMGAGFALALRQLRPEAVALAFFGEGAANQGMLLETLNLAAAWQLPLLFVCKDNGWSITTRTETVTGGDLTERAASFGLRTVEIDGRDVEEVWETAGDAIEALRQGDERPGFIRARCAHLDGHFLGDPVIATARRPLKEGRETLLKVAQAGTSRRGASFASRARGIAYMLDTLRVARTAGRSTGDDPILRTRKQLEGRGVDVDPIEQRAHDKMSGILQEALREGPARRPR